MLTPFNIIFSFLLILAASIDGDRLDDVDDMPSLENSLDERGSVRSSPLRFFKGIGM